MKNLIWNYRFIIVVVVTVLLYFLLLYLFARQKFISTINGIMLMAKKKAKDAVEEAKEDAKDLVLNSSQSQEDWVVVQAYKFLPKWITFFISEPVMHKIVHFLYEKAKDYLDDGQINNSIK